jgi:hypothetical protein
VKDTRRNKLMKMFTTIAVATALFGLAACTKNEPAPAPAVTEAAGPAANEALATANATAPAESAGGGKPAEGVATQPK